MKDFTYNELKIKEELGLESTLELISKRVDNKDIMVLDISEFKGFNPCSIWTFLSNIKALKKWYKGIAVEFNLKNKETVKLASYGFFDNLKVSDKDKVIISEIASVAHDVSTGVFGVIEEKIVAEISGVADRFKNLWSIPIGDAEHIARHFLDEILDNVVVHSGEKDAYVIANNYKDFVTITISDAGKGFYEATRKKAIEDGCNDTEKDVLEWALKYKNSAKTKLRNRGYGLSSAAKLVDRYGGYIRIVTGNVQYINDNGAITYTDLSFDYQGASIYIKLPKVEMNDAGDDELDEFVL